MAKKRKWWGRSLILDMYGCDPEMIKDTVAMKKFVRELCKFLKMKRHGPTLVERFGSGKLRGYSMFQFIETSTIVAHFDELENRAFIDIFSCKKYNPKAAKKFCMEFFKAKGCSTVVDERV